MPFYVKKSVTAGLFRFNLSKGGLGVSFGIPGLRLGTGPRGHYVHAGRGGLYYRASLKGVSPLAPKITNSKNDQRIVETPQNKTSFQENDVQMNPISSSDVLSMTSVKHEELVSELNRNQNRYSFAVIFGLIAVVLCYSFSRFMGDYILQISAVVILFSSITGKYIDTQRRSSVVLYDIDAEMTKNYEELMQAFDELSKSKMIWHIDSRGQIHDLHTWKRNAGASSLVDRRPTQFGYGLPRVLKANIVPPFMKAGKEFIYWLPDVVLVVENRKVGAISYDDLQVEWHSSRFIEEEHVPSDAVIVDHTWKHPNKSGGPDRRFSNNRQIPICAYESIHLSSNTGLNELVQVSSNGKAKIFAESVRNFTRFLKSIKR